MRIFMARLRWSLVAGVTLAFGGGCDRPTAPSAPAPPSVSALSSPATSAPAPPSPAAADTKDAETPIAMPVTFDNETLGAPSPELEGVIGEWYVFEDGGERGLRVDGSKWREGTPSASLADQAKRLYGDRSAQFFDGVRAFATFPLAVYQGAPAAGDVVISVRFYPEAGHVDQGAGIAFGIGPDGSYQGVRANALEDNLLYFKVTRGRRNVIDDVRNTPTPTKKWHTLSVALRGAKMSVELDGTKRLDRTLDAPPVGRVGLWSKADSQVLFDDFSVKRL